VLARRGSLAALALAALAVLAAVWAVPRSWWPGAAGSVVVYCSQDQVFAEPVFAEFRRRTGIRVDAVFDSEAVKTVGLANRLLAERGHPRCDLWWSNEELRTRQLAAQGIFARTNEVRSFGRRTRTLVVQAGAAEFPASVLELTNARWRGRISVAFPLFGTTATHLLALRTGLGTAGWSDWCSALARNRPFIEEGNSHVVRRVARGEAVVGLTDSDDVAAAVREGLPVRALPPDTWMLAIPNTVALVKPAAPGGPADRLAGFLASPEVVALLASAGAFDAGGSSAAEFLHPDWDAVLRDLGETTAELERVFRR
jgi:iron(III) transport system substrate-binding protein